MEEPAEIDVVGARIERSVHDVEVEPVVEAVHADGRVGERSPKRLRVGRVDVLVPLEPEVGAADRRPPLLEEARDVPADRAGRTEHRDHCAKPTGGGRRRSSGNLRRWAAAAARLSGSR